MIALRRSAWIAIPLFGAAAISIFALAADVIHPNAKRMLVESVQPEYSKWALVKSGMTDIELRKLLGNPIDDPESGPGLLFGRIKFDSQSMPAPFDFYVLIHEGKVIQKGDQFGGDLSKDGKPTTPTPIYPIDGSGFTHYPRFVDLRWNPSSGTYPMEYTVEVESGQHEVHAKGERAVLVYHRSIEMNSELPYAAFAFGGKNPGRWRVKAKNALGESDWSKWRHFQFEQ